MRRTVIFATLVSLLIVVAGVSAAQDGVFDPGQQETTVPEPTNPEPTSPEPANPGANIAQPTLEEELPGKREGTTVERPDDKGAYDGGGKDANGPSEPENEGRENARGEAPGKGGPGGSGGEDEEREGSGGEKVSVCHEGKTLSVGAPAEPAHLGHGDSPGPC